MERSSTIRTTQCFDRKFEELALFTHFQTGERFSAGLIDGEFEVTWTQDGTWWISDIWIKTDNFRHGAHAKSGTINLNADTDERLYLSILDSLQERYCDSIDEQIADELAVTGEPRSGIRLVA